MKPKILNAIFVVFSVLLLNNAISLSQWYQLTTNTAENLQDIYFINSNTGIAVGMNGKIIRTTDAGSTWISVASGTANALFSLDFPDNMTGFTGGQTGTVLRTLNGGGSWSPRTGCGININSIAFFNINIGITAGGGTLMCFTTDAGLTWNPRYSPSFAVAGVTFISADTLFIACTDLPGAAIFKSVNTGYNWTSVLFLNNSGVDMTYSLTHIYFKDRATGFSTGSHTFFGQTWGDVHRSTNGGINWTMVGSTASQSGSGLRGIYFGEPSTGFTCGNNGAVMRSTNGGTNWSPQSSGVTSALNAVYMINDLTGYICGNGGLVLKTTNGGVTGFVKSGEEIPAEYSLHQNYPNPFNPVTKIKFDIPSNVKPVNKTSNVKLAVYDILGREISVLVNEGLTPGTYEVEWDGSNYTSGVYFYKLVVSGAEPLTASDYFETKKMNLIK